MNFVQSLQSKNNNSNLSFYKLERLVDYVYIVLISDEDSESSMTIRYKVQES